MRCNARKDFGYIETAIPILPKLKRARHQWAWMALPDDHLSLAREGLAGELVQRGLRIERVHVTDAAAHEEGDDALCAGLEMRLLRVAWVGANTTVPGEEIVLIQQRQQAQTGDSAT